MEPLTEADPERIGLHVLVARLGAGGMGRVYLGRSPGGRLVAVKVVREEIVGHPEALARFRREVETVRAVRSAYTANLIDASLDAAPYWLATEYVAGPTLADAVRGRGALPPDTCRGLGAALAEGLASVHAYGVTHRDLKPQNVILAAQGPQLIDFGIAHGVGSTPLTETGRTPGTPGFTAPEVLVGGVAGAAADVFALGATLAYAATGRAPFGGGAAASVGFRAVYEGIDLAGVEPGLAALIEDCVAKDPADRPEPAEVIRRCGVRGALVEDPVYAGLTAPPERATGATGVADATGVTRATGMADAASRAGVADAASGVGSPTRRLDDATPPTGAAALSSAAGAATPYEGSAARSGGRGRVGAVAGVVLAVAVAVLLWRFPFGEGRGGDGVRTPGSGTPANPASGSPAPRASGSPASEAVKPGKGGGWAGEDFRWKLSADAEMARYGAGDCDVSAELRPPGRGMETSTVSSNTNGVPGDTARVRFRPQRGAEPGAHPAPYPVVIAVKPPHAPKKGQTGFLSAPVDLYAGWDADDYGELTYPDDFPGAVPLSADKGDWTVVFYRVEDGAKRYTPIACNGFRVG
ncbi:serine/threonine-protein kinase [Streptomyces sp. NPDC059382]|uniref:serine/threonine-protein kinase n=1 Tax=Streptomyces sp. NPDC059382 TaxID=3346816 RepID=UPI0036C0AC95